MRLSRFAWPTTCDGLRDFSRGLSINPTTLSRNIKPLKHAGYVDTHVGAGRRPDIISLTISGQTVLNKAKALWKDTQHDLTHRIGPERAGQLLEILGQL